MPSSSIGGGGVLARSSLRISFCARARSLARSLQGACFKKGHMAMVTELMPEGSVSDLLRNPKASISLLHKLSIARVSFAPK